MESSHLQALCSLLTNEPTYTFLHLACCLVGKSQRQNIPRLIALLQEISYLIGQHARLARTSTSYHQLRPVTIFHSSALTIVQLIEYMSGECWRYAIDGKVVVEVSIVDFPKMLLAFNRVLWRLPNDVFHAFRGLYRVCAQQAVLKHEFVSQRRIILISKDDIRLIASHQRIATVEQNATSSSVEAKCCTTLC